MSRACRTASLTVADSPRRLRRVLDVMISEWPRNDFVDIAIVIFEPLCFF